MRRYLLLILAIALVLPLFGSSTPASAAGYRGEGVVNFVADGDTIDVKMNGTVVRVRFIGIQTMEIRDYTNKTGDCHAREAALRLEQLVLRKTVRLYSQDPNATSFGRAFRSVSVFRDGAWRDVGQILLDEGHAIWSPHPTEFERNRDYNYRAARASSKGIGVWDRDYCGYGPNQGTRLAVWAQSDAEGNDALNINGEWVKFKNLNRSVDLRIGGWTFRDAALREYRFPSWAVIPAGRSITLYPGKGTNSSSRFYWGLGGTIFENVSADGRNMGDGAYLYDPQGDLRWWFTYPCVYNCVNRLYGKLRMYVGYLGGDPLREYVDIRNVSAAPVNLEGYLVESKPYSYTFGPTATIPAGKTLRILIGRGTDRTLLKYWGKTSSILNDGGDVVELRSFDYIRSLCRTWGTGRC